MVSFHNDKTVAKIIQKVPNQDHWVKQIHEPMGGNFHSNRHTQCWT